MATPHNLSRRDVLRLGGLTLAGATLLSACGGDSGSTGQGAPNAKGPYKKPAKSASGVLTISNWGDPKDKAVYADVMKRFNAKFPQVKVQDNFTPITTWSEYVNKVLTQAAAGNAPDVINIAIEGVRLGLDKNMFTELDGYISKDPEGAALTKDVDPRLLDSLGLEGKQYLLPSNWNTMLIYYNTKMFEAAGIEPPSDDWTWDDFLAIAQKLTTGTGGSKVFGFAIPYFNFGLTPWFYSNGTSQVSKDLTKSNLTDPKLVESATFIRDLVTKHGVAPQPKGADPYQLFPAQKVAMTGAGHWVTGPFNDAGFKDYDVLPWPQKAEKATVYGVAGFGIHPQTKNRDLAWEYVKELAGTETQKAWVANGAATPASKTAAQSAEFLAAPESAELYYEAIEYARPVQAPTVFNVLEPAVMRAMDEIMSGKDPAASFAKADKETTAAFEGS